MSGFDAFDNTGLSWQADAACVGHDPEMFFSERFAAAVAVCAGCPVRERCLSWAIETGQQFGVWGGMTETPRMRLIRAARKAKGAA